MVFYLHRIYIRGEATLLTFIGKIYSLQYSILVQRSGQNLQPQPHPVLSSPLLPHGEAGWVPTKGRLCAHTPQ